MTDQELQNIEDNARQVRYWQNIEPQDVLAMADELRRLRAVLDAARQLARDGNWNGCKAALFETGGDA